MQEANRRVVYVSGPPGAGKSTLWMGLVKDEGIIISEQIAHIALDDILDRQLWRIFLHFLEHRINLRTALEHPEAIILGDRCIIDDEAYHEVFHRLGWLSDNEHSMFKYLIGWLHFFFRTPAPENAIIIIPPFEWNQERIKAAHRQNGEKVKWWEDNWSYLREVRGAFEGLVYKYSQVTPKKYNSLALRETDRNLRLAQIRRWIEEVRGR